MNATVLNAINEQINSEFEASHTYLAMAAFCDQQKFLGAAKWLRLQSDEERAPRAEAVRLRARARRQGGAEDASTSRKPTSNRSAAVFEQALEARARVTAQINALYELCFQEKAFAEMTELQWFLTEQVEEEKIAREIVAKFRMVKSDPSGLLDLDRELGSRAAVPKQAR